MAEFTTLPSPTMEKQHKRPISSSFFSSPRLFTGFANPKPEPESVMSPTSTLDSKPFSHLRSPFSSEPNSLNKPGFSEPEPAKTRPWKKPDSQGIGLGIVSDESSDPREPKPATRMLLFGSHLKIQIPIQPEPPKPADFGIRTRNSRTGSGFSIETPRSGRVFSGSITPTEMELSEEYTCVITHGPNPKTTHIFDNCVVLGFSEAGKDGEDRTVGSADRTVGFASESFLSFCCTCKRNLGPGKDTYMYRGEKAFCSHECRCEEMLLEEQADKIGM